MKYYFTTIVAICLLLIGASQSTQAQTTPTDSIPPSFWDNVKSEVHLSYADYKGNTEKIDVNYGFKMVKKGKRNTLSLSVGGAYGEANKETNQEKYFVNMFDEVKFNKVVGGYGKYGYLKDPFAGYNNLHKIGLGALFTIKDTKKLSLKTRLGYELRLENYTDEDAEDMALNTGKAGFRIKFTLMESIAFKSEINYQVDFNNTENYFADGLAAVVFDVNKNIDIEMSYFLDYKNTPPEGAQALDKVFRTALKIKF